MRNRRDFFKAALLGACALASRGALADDIAESARNPKGNTSKKKIFLTPRRIAGATKSTKSSATAAT